MPNRTIIICSVAVLLSLVPYNIALADHSVYQKAAPSAVAFLSRNGRIIGAGSLIDAEKKLVVTANHVVNAQARLNLRVLVFFPEIKDGQIITDSVHYRLKVGQVSIAGKVVYHDYIRDLALVQLDSLPKDVKALPLATKDPRPGESVHVIGNSTGRWGGVFGYNKGYVRNSFQWAFPPYFFYALSHHSPTNKGDSGGPVINDKGELVGVVSSGTIGMSNDPKGWTFAQQVVDHSVHVKEVRAMLKAYQTGERPYQVPSGDAISLKGQVNMVDDDYVMVSVRRGENIKVSLSGQGSTNMDFYLDPGDGAKPASAQIGQTDQESVDFTPKWTGICRIKIRNLFLKKDIPPNEQQSVTKTNTFTLSVKWSKSMEAPVTVMRKLLGKATDELQLHYEKGEGKARVWLIGDGDTDLDVHVLDPHRKIVAKGETIADREIVTWTPQMTGIYTIRIKNIGPIWNQYALATD